MYGEERKLVLVCIQLDGVRNVGQGQMPLRAAAMASDYLSDQEEHTKALYLVCLQDRRTFL